jgi:hypothetical protein
MMGKAGRDFACQRTSKNAVKAASHILTRKDVAVTPDLCAKKTPLPANYVGGGCQLNIAGIKKETAP